MTDGLSQGSKDRIVHDAVAEARGSRLWWVIIALGAVTVLALALAIYNYRHEASQADTRADVAEAETGELVEQVAPLTDRILEICRGGGPPAASLPEGVCQAALQAEEQVEETETDEPELQDVEIQDPEIDDPDPDDPERQQPEQQDPERQDPENQDPDSDDPESQDGEVDDPDPTDDPDPDDPDSNDPDPTDDPDPNDPDPTDDPDPNDADYPESFTFEWMGQTWRCTDPDDDHHYTCEPEES